MPTNESEKFLERTIAAIGQQKQAIKMYLGEGSSMDALHCCASALRGLNTSCLSPKSYYELYIKAVEVLNMIEVYLTDSFQQGRSIPHLYEIVQYASNVLPRLYLLITVGVVYIRVGELPCREILGDLVEMCRGVQHPLRGLFLRNYLLTSIPPNLLPDSPPKAKILVNENEHTKTTAEEANVLDSVNFILLNFAEMNKLWVRMQHQGHTRDRERREQERRDLCVLVGANLHRLSQLETITTDLYLSQILPSILTQVIQCHDVIAQEYLMDVIVQTFPDEFHAATLTQLLQTCGDLQPAVRLKPIIGSLVERLLRYISEDSRSGGCAGEGLFQSLSTELGQLVRRRADLYTSSPTEARLGLPTEDLPGLFAPLLTMAIYLHSSPDIVNQVLLSAASAFETLSVASYRIQGGSVLSRELLNLLYLPLYGPGGPPRSVNSSVECATLSLFSSGASPPLQSLANNGDDAGALGSLSLLLRLSGLLRLCALLDVSGRRRFACLFIARALERASSGDAAVADGQRITTEADLDAFFIVVGVLVDRQDPNTTSPSPLSSTVEDAAEELSLLASAIHLVGRSSETLKDIEEKLLLLIKMRKRLAAGGPIVVRATFPTLVFEAIRLLPLVGMSEQGQEIDEEMKESLAGQFERIIAFCHQSATKLIACNAPDVALRLFLNCTLVIEKVAFEKRPLFAYEFFSQAFTLFEQELSDARAQLSAFGLLVATLWRVRRCLDAESAGVLQTQCSRAAFNLLLLRADQSRAAAMTAQLLLPQPVSRDTNSGSGKENISAEADEGVFKCLEKSRSLADMCMDMDARAQLYVDLMNYHIIYYQQGVGSLETMRAKLKELLADTDKLVQQLEFVPDTLSLYLESTRVKALEILI